MRRGGAIFWILFVFVLLVVVLVGLIAIGIHDQREDLAAYERQRDRESEYQRITGHPSPSPVHVIVDNPR